jgi:hypothetical protein
MAYASTLDIDLVWENFESCFDLNFTLVFKSHAP